MTSWLAPFIVVAIIALLYFFPGGRGTNPRGRAMHRDINLYFVCVLLTAVVSIIGSVRYGRDWVDIAAWVVAAVCVGVAVYRFFNAEGSTRASSGDEPGPLERARKK